MDLKPYYQDDACIIYHGDCREVLPQIESAGMVLTDPPYGIDWKRGTWDDSSEQYPALIRWLTSEANRLVVNGWVFVFQAGPNIPRFNEWFPEGWRIYAACKNFAQIRPTGIWHAWDPCVFWVNGSPVKQRQTNRDWFVGNTAGAFGEKINHPTPKPLDTIKHIIQIASGEGDLIVDPFMGSGTTLRAAKDMGRKAIGIEMEEKYCEIAVKRLRQEVLPFAAA